MYTIANYDKLYRPCNKSGGELQHPDFVKLPVKPKGDGLQELFEYNRGLEVFGIWCLLLEKTTSEKPENRGKLLNHKEESATAEEIAKGISLKHKTKLVFYALNVLTTIGWLTSSEPSEQCSAKVPPKLSKDKLSKGEDKEKRKFVPPTLEEVEKYIQENNYDVDAAKFIKYYASSDPPWYDQNGKPVHNWKQKLIAVWADRKKKPAPKKCVKCPKIGVYAEKDDTEQVYWLCEQHKLKPKPLEGIPLPQMKPVDDKVSNDFNEQRNKSRRALGIK